MPGLYRIVNIPEKFLNMAKYVWIYLNILEYAWICLNLPEWLLFQIFSYFRGPMMLRIAGCGGSWICIYLVNSSYFQFLATVI